MDHYKELFVSQDDSDYFEQACREPGICVEKDRAVFDEEVVFDDGMRMAIQVVTTTEPMEEDAWTQGVLFDSVGNECGCTDCGDSFLGEYTIWVGSDSYTCNVISKVK